MTRLQTAVTTAWKLWIAAGLVVLAAALVPMAQARGAATLNLTVTFTATGSITVTLPDGTPVGTTSGTPTTIPAGYYTVQEWGPGGCTQVPYFEIHGPQENVRDNLTEGEVNALTYTAYFAPSSTYTWINDATGTPHTFVTGSTLVGTPPPVAGSTLANAGEASSQDLVGSAVAPFRGKLVGTVTATGKLSLLFKGARPTTLAPGRYTVVVKDQSTKVGLKLAEAKGMKMTVTTAPFTGTRTASIKLTSGKVSVGTTAGVKSFSLAVS